MSFKEKLAITASEARKSAEIKLLRELEATREGMKKTPEERRWERVGKVISNLEKTCLTAASQGKKEVEILFLNFSHGADDTVDCIYVFDGQYHRRGDYQPWVIKVQEAIEALGLEYKYVNEHDGFGQWSRDYLAAKWED